MYSQSHLCQLHNAVLVGENGDDIVTEGLVDRLLPMGIIILHFQTPRVVKRVDDLEMLSEVKDDFAEGDRGVRDLGHGLVPSKKKGRNELIWYLQTLMG